jgi:hypothetical protein
MVSLTSHFTNVQLMNIHVNTFGKFNVPFLLSVMSSHYNRSIQTEPQPSTYTTERIIACHCRIPPHQFASFFILFLCCFVLISIVQFKLISVDYSKYMYIYCIFFPSYLHMYVLFHVTVSVIIFF